MISQDTDVQDIAGSLRDKSRLLQQAFHSQMKVHL